MGNVINKKHYAGNTYKVLTHSRSAVSALQAGARKHYAERLAERRLSPIAGASKCDARILSNSSLKTPFAINSFALS